MSTINQSDQEIRIGVIGFGFMGRTHAKAYQCAQQAGYPCKVAAVADTGLQSLDQTRNSAGNISGTDFELDTSEITLFHDARELIDRSDIDLVSICTHTDSHVELAVQALNANKHVLVEKPVAINPDDVFKLVTAANNSKHLCIPAMCMRFWPAWSTIREMITSKQYGPVRSAVFHRLGSRPTWAAKFYTDETRSGGVLYDLHIHDSDFIVHCFGLPQAVTTVGDGMHLSTHYHFSDGPTHVLAHAAWDHQPSIGFKMQCTIVCEDATIDFDLNRKDQLLVHQAESTTTVDVGDLTGYDNQTRYVLDLIAGQPDAKISTMNDAAMTANMLAAQSQSMTVGEKIFL